MNKMPNKNYKEILKLKGMLEEAKIPFYFRDNHFDGYQICYPNKGEERVCSVVEFEGSYGSHSDLLEIMGLLTKTESIDDEVVGYLTAENVFERIKKHYEGGFND